MINSLFRTFNYFLCLILLFLIGCFKKQKRAYEDIEILTLGSIANYYHLKDFDKCIAQCKKFTVQYPRNDKCWHLLSSSYLAIEKDSLAEICANQSLKLNPKNPIALTNKGIILDKRHEPTKALIFYEQSLKINDSLFQTYSNYLINRIKAGDYNKAVVLGEKATKYGNNIWDKAHLCLCYHYIGDYKKRDSLFEVLRISKFTKLEGLKSKFTENSK
jgi:tetratricopeptide (TPR) repeat protein